MVLAYGWFRVLKVSRFKEKADREQPLRVDSSLPAVSVIVYSQGEAENLAVLLPAILNQDYPSPFEVIVVNDGENVDVRDVVGLLRPLHPNLYLTFTPEGVVGLSRKKLAITLGIKAARHPVVALTTAGGMIGSRLWLRDMASPFVNPRVGVSLGYAYIDPSEDNMFGARARAFDYVADSCRWLSVAIASRPFRGTEYNLLLRKSLFLESKGFASHLNLHHGVDDIFLSKIATKENTAVVLTDTSMVRILQGNHPRMALERALTHRFTEKFIRHPRILGASVGWLRLGVWVFAALTVVAGWPDLWWLFPALCLPLGQAAIDWWMWSRAGSALRARPLRWSIPILALTRPFRRMAIGMRALFGKQKNYTWD